MRLHSLLLLLPLGLSVLPLRAVEIDPACPSYRPAGAVSAHLTTIGSDSLAEEMRLWAQLLHAAQPGVTIDVQPKGSNFSAQAMADGRSNFAYSGRLIPDDELDLVARVWGFRPLRILVSGPDPAKPTTTHPQVAWVNEHNPLHALTLAQLDAVFSRSLNRGGTKVVTTWGELGLTGPWADAPIHKFALNATGGPGMYVKETLLLGGQWSADLKDIREEKVVGQVAQDPYAIGITGLPYGAPGVRALALARDASQPPVEPVLANFISRSYPLSRFNYVYVKKAPGQPLDPVIKELLHLILSRQGQAAALQAHFLPLNPEMLLQELALIDAM